MPSPALKDLLPREVQFGGQRFVFLEDRHIYDSTTIATGDTTARFFLTLTGKESSQANFRGDQSLVREDNIFVPLQVSIGPRFRTFSNAEYVVFYGQGNVVFQITSPQKITVLEDRNVNVAPAVALESFDGGSLGVDKAVPWARRFEDRRTFIIPENKIVRGGRNIDFRLEWNEAAGNGLSLDTDVFAEFYGAEYEPA